MSQAVSMDGATSSSMLGRANTAGTIASVRANFPGAEVTEGGWHDDGADRAGRREMANLHTSLLWDGLEGYACLWVGIGGRFTGTRYSFASQTQRFFAWPAQRREFLDAAMKAAPTADVYLTPMLRAERSRKHGTGTPSRYLWADVDGEWTAARGDALVPMMAEGSFVVASGSGRHVYVRLSAPLAPERVEHLNRRLAVALDGDAKWDSTALLRLAGTWNHKGYARGTGSTLVEWWLP